MLMNKTKKINYSLVTTLEDKENYFVHIYALKQALLHGLILKKFIELFFWIKKEC